MSNYSRNEFAIELLKIMKPYKEGKNKLCTFKAKLTKILDKTSISRWGGEIATNPYRHEENERKRNAIRILKEGCFKTKGITTKIPINSINSYSYFTSKDSNGYNESTGKGEIKVGNESISCSEEEIDLLDEIFAIKGL